MNKILIITTEGCEACKIAEVNINKAVFQSSKEIQVDVKNHKDINKNDLRSYKATDYPTVVYIVGGLIRLVKSGTYPAAVYLRWIDMYLV